MESTAPSGSMALSSGSRDFGTKNQPPTNATAMTGRYTRNADPNQKCPSTQPVMTGPIDPATPVVVAQMAIALARSCGGNTLTRIDRVAGMMNAAPSPIAARQAMISVTSLACDARKLATKNVANPNCSAPLRPNRSPSAPDVKSRPANTSEYTATTHWSCDSLAPRSRDSVGSATLSVELPPNTMSRLRQSTASVHHRRA